jgi:hypothetical protein
VVKRINLRSKPKDRWFIAKFILRVLFVIGIIFTFLFIKDIFTPTEPFISLVVATKPIRIIFIDTESKKISITSLPEKVIIKGSGGYGQYPAISLWKLGEIDKKSGKLLSQSLEDVIGLPIPYFIGKPDPETSGATDAVKSIRSLFSYSLLIPSIRFSYKLNIPFKILLSTIWYIQTTPIDDFSDFDFNDVVSNHQVVLSDNSIGLVLGPQSADSKIDREYELTKISNEALKAVVINNSPVMGVGQQMARVLSHVGVRVVAVENDKKTTSKCLISGNKTVLKSDTVKILIHAFNCEVKNSETDGLGDFIIYSGELYAKRFF